MEHRLPENHDCPHQPPRIPLGSWQTRKAIARVQAEKKTGEFESEGDYHFVRKKLKTIELPSKTKTKRIVKVSIASFAVIACSVLLFFYVIPNIPKLINPNTYTYSETFQLSSVSLVPVTRSVELRKGQQLIGTFKFTNLPSLSSGEHFSVAVAILDPNGELIALFENKQGTFNITASYSGIYRIRFTYLYLGSRQISPPYVTLKYEIRG